MVTAIADRLAQDPRARGLLDRLGRHSPEVISHGAKVAALSVRIAQAMTLDAARLTLLARAALLHDIGKQEVPVEILDKPGRLEPGEWRVIERHPLVGYRMLVEAGFTEEAAIVLHHHERIDGRGYPTGLGGDRIPLEARILSAADAYDAMTSSRPYRAAMTPAAAVAELAAVAGRQCDAACVRALATVVAAPVAA